MTLRNEVYLNRVTFKNNSAFKAGGGIDIGYIDSASSSPITNHVNIENSLLTMSAMEGVLEYTPVNTACVQESDSDDDVLVFRSCVCGIVAILVPQ